MEDDQQPTLRIAGYVKPIAKHRAPESPQITWPEITDYWPDSAAPNGAWHGLLPPNAYSISSDDPPTGERGRSWLQRPVILTGMTALLVVFGTVLLARPLAH
ncbi:MAG TPA: hypothetical protein VN408_31535, partial [Actinoplanes sp.]|nr:hypothetical protein [Actinoplanes sp.]